MAKKTEQLVHCRYPKCMKLHETTELSKDDAVKGGSKNSYYHPDCWHVMQTINQIRDLFIHEINPAMTGKQIGTLVSAINNMVFGKNIDVDFIKFALEYFVKYKPGSLHQPFGMYYIVENYDVINAWKKEQDRRTRVEISESQKENNKNIEELDLQQADFTYKPVKSKGFEDILR